MRLRYRTSVLVLLGLCNFGPLVWYGLLRVPLPYLGLVSLSLLLATTVP